MVGLLTALAAAVVPPLLAQAQQLWLDLPARLELLQLKLVEWGIVPVGTSLTDLLTQAPMSGSADAVSTVLVALWGIVGGVFGVVTILLLPECFHASSCHGVMKLGHTLHSVSGLCAAGQPWAGTR